MSRRLFILLTSLLFPIVALAQTTPPVFDSSVTVLHPSPGISYLYDQRGNSATVYEVNHGMSWYSQQDRYGKIQSQGYVFDPLGKPQELRVPESMRYQPSITQDPRR